MTANGDDPGDAGEDRPADTDELTEMYNRSPDGADGAGVPADESPGADVGDGVSDDEDGAPGTGGDSEDPARTHGEPGVGDGGDGDSPSAQSDEPVGEHSSDPETATGTFYVKYAADVSVTLHEVDTGQIVTLVENPGFEANDIVEATLVAQPPMEVSYLVEELHAHYSVPVETSPEPPTRQVQDIAAELDETQAVAIEREGKGEIHVLCVAPDTVERTAEEVHEDEMTYKNAARYDVERVELRTDESGIVSIRYLP